MVLALQALNEDATLNNFFDIGSHRFVVGSDAVLLFRILQPQKDGLRYVPDSGATITMDFIKSDTTVISKTATHPFADDRSIIQVTLTDIETAELIGQNLVAKLDEGGDITYAILENGLQLVNLTPPDC